MTPQCWQLWSLSIPSSAKVNLHRDCQSTRWDVETCRVSTNAAWRYTSTYSISSIVKLLKGFMNMEHLYLLTFLVVLRGSREASLTEPLPSAGPGEEADGAKSQEGPIWVREGCFWQCTGLRGTGQTPHTDLDFYITITVWLSHCFVRNFVFEIVSCWMRYSTLQKIQFIQIHYKALIS